jgi:hypothetical protein
VQCSRSTTSSGRQTKKTKVTDAPAAWVRASGASRKPGRRRSPVARTRNEKPGRIPAPASGQAQRPPAPRLSGGGRAGGSEGSESNFIAPRSLQRAPILRDTRLLEEHCPACTCTALPPFASSGRRRPPGRHAFTEGQNLSARGLKKILLVLQLSSCKVCRRHGIQVGSPRQQQHILNAGTTGRRVVDRASTRTPSLMPEPQPQPLLASLANGNRSAKGLIRPAHEPAKQRSRPVLPPIHSRPRSGGSVLAPSDQGTLRDSDPGLSGSG